VVAAADETTRLNGAGAGQAAHPVLRILVLAAVVPAVLSLLVSIRDIQRFGGTDLRARVVGARTILAGDDPYFRPVRSDELETLQDPDRYARQFTRCTYPPSLLLFYLPLAPLPYGVQRVAHFVLEWGAMTGSIAIVALHMPAARHRWTMALVGLAFFAAAYFWRLHLERGQYYVFVLASLSAGAAILVRRGDSHAAGVMFALAAAMRLTPALLVVPLWLAGHRRTAVTMAGSGLVILIATLAMGPSLWGSFFRHVKLHEQAVIDPTFYQREKSQLPALPTTVENASFATMLDSHSANLTLQGFVLPRLTRFASIAPEYWPLMAKGCAGAVIVAYLAMLLVSRQALRRADTATQITLALLPVLIVDFLLPIRWNYADVLLLLPIGLLYPMMLAGRTQRIGAVLVGAGILLCHQFAFAANIGLTQGYIRPVVITAGLSLVAAYELHASKARKWSKQVK
jgi:hypothetical protein